MVFLVRVTPGSSGNLGPGPESVAKIGLGPGSVLSIPAHREPLCIGGASGQQHCRLGTDLGEHRRRDASPLINGDYVGTQDSHREHL